MKMLTALLALLIGSTTPALAATYIGPGAGLSLLGAVWALLAAIFAAIAFVVAWPLRRLMIRKREKRGQLAPQEERHADARHVDPVSIGS